MLLIAAFNSAQELPRPTYDNSVIYSITYGLNGSATEIDYIKDRFWGGLYAPLYFSHFVDFDMAWGTDPAQAEDNIDAFKSRIEGYITKAKQYDIGMHIIVKYGLARYPDAYKAAKEEDTRNAQWYNDNNLASASQVSSTMNDKVFGTFSRYARKLREFHEAKIAAMCAFLQEKQAENPDLYLIFSGPGEAEMNYNRIDNGSFMQDYFCDYSPFAVLEFRDWIRHSGMYAVGGTYYGEGYSGGGARYQGGSGLANFNSDFGTTFASWDLKYYDWNLSDGYTAGAIPFSGYSFGGQMPSSGPNYTAGGFDPPRVMVEPGTNDFWDLWNDFRELMVGHYVKDMAAIARDSGFPKKQYYTHQIPADYLFGTRPNDPLIPYLNPRYYSSASPMWTADAYSDTGLAITLYDVRINESLFFRTSQYVLPDVQAMSTNWAALEYNPEVHPTGGIPMSSVAELYAQMIRLYEHNVHMISLFVWDNDPEEQYKGTNRELAAIQLWENIRDCARQPVGTQYSPPIVPWLNGGFNPGSGEIDLTWSEEIWSDLAHKWENWGDFDEFVIYRGYSPDFACNGGSEIARVDSGYGYSDSGFSTGGYVYYKIAAINDNATRGPVVSSGPVIPEADPLTLDVSRNAFIFTHEQGGPFTSPQQFMVLNLGSGSMSWTISSDSSWLLRSPAAGVNSQFVSVSVNPSGLSTGAYSGTLTVNAPGAYGNPKYVNVTLNVVNAGATDPPFGYWDTPINGVTQVRGSIPVTGWALDDIEVARIEIKRRPEPEDPPAAIGGDGLVYIGDALFVEGSRSDIEENSYYAQFPLSYRSGWGYMMLTYGLPRSGNGDYLLYAYAYDAEGNKTSLGTKAITCDNANAVKPFGTIDTPAPGMVFPDSTYGNVNFGWVLTPQPKNIPLDGSTIFVYINGDLKGNVDEYGNYSASVAAAFPGYANTNTAVGHYLIDLAAYSSGVHTIGWEAYDNEGAGDGIGSRFFTILNTGGGGSVQSVAEYSGTSLKVSDLSTGLVNFTQPAFIHNGLGRNQEIRRVYPDQEGIIRIKMKEVSRLDLKLPNRGNRVPGIWQGYLTVGDELRKLPIGSTLKPRQGAFLWQPGPGFIGEYKLVFLLTTRSGIRKKITVTIDIVPKNER